VVNPNSGKKRDPRPLIAQRLYMEKIPFEFLLSTRKFMTWEIGYELDMDKYSALVAVGGDGTYHEVVNGMLHRKDKRRLPVAFIPNGSGNDTCRNIGVNDIGKALDYIVKGDSLKVDLTKLLIDYSTEEEIPQDQKPNKLRYQLCVSCIGFPARITHRARHWKWCCCNPYQLSALGEIIQKPFDVMDLYLGEKVFHEDLATPMIMSMTGKYTGNGMLLSPTSTINDGKMEILYVTEKHSFLTLAEQMDKAVKAGGVQAYEPIIKTLRGKEMKFVMKAP
jgi:diacylglycerol kinase (ATP)